MTSTTYRVTGMTCDHCVRAVSSEGSQIDGVTDVQVGVPIGQVTVVSDALLDIDVVRAAVDEAGYELAS